MYFGISGYNFVCKNRASKTGGDVALSISEYFDYEVRCDLVYPDVAVFESVFVELLYSDSKNNLIVEVIYRSPGCEASEFNKMFEPLLQKVVGENKKAILTAEFNLECYDVHDVTNTFFNNMISHSFSPLLII